MSNIHFPTKINYLCTYLAELLDNLLLFHPPFKAFGLLTSPAATICISLPLTCLQDLIFYFQLFLFYRTSRLLNRNNRLVPTALLKFTGFPCCLLSYPRAPSSHFPPRWAKFPLTFHSFALESLLVCCLLVRAC